MADILTSWLTKWLTEWLAASWLQWTDWLFDYISKSQINSFSISGTAKYLTNIGMTAETWVKTGKQHNYELRPPLLQTQRVHCCLFTVHKSVHFDPTYDDWKRHVNDVCLSWEIPSTTKKHCLVTLITTGCKWQVKQVYSEYQCSNDNQNLCHSKPDKYKHVCLVVSLNIKISIEIFTKL